MRERYEQTVLTFRITYVKGEAVTTVMVKTEVIGDVKQCISSYQHIVRASYLYIHSEAVQERCSILNVESLCFSNRR